MPFGFGAGQPMKLLPFQREWITEVFADGIRSAALSLPRGNGKTGLCAAIALAELHLNEFSPEVVLAAVTVGQLTRASGVFGVMKRMTELEPELDNRSLVFSSPSNTVIKVPVNGGSAYPISTRNEGAMMGLALSLAICDEAAFLDIEEWQALTGAAGKRPQSLVVAISTPGLQDSALHVLKKAVDEGAEMPGFSWTEYAAPENTRVDDRAAWAKANPALGTYLSEDALAADLATSPEVLFRVYHLGQWRAMGTEDCWLGPKAADIWDGLSDSEYGFDPGLPVFVGVDVAQYFDSTAVIAVQERPDGRWHAKAQVWFPGQGTVDQAEVRQYLRDLCGKYRVGAIGYDPRLFLGSAQDLHSEGYPMLEIPQSPARLVPAIGNTYQMITKKELTHDGNPAMRQQILNAVPRPSESGFTLRKQKGKQQFRIDCAVALAFALSVRDAYVPSPDAQWIA